MTKKETGNTCSLICTSINLDIIKEILQRLSIDFNQTLCMYSVFYIKNNLFVIIHVFDGEKKPKQ